MKMNEFAHLLFWRLAEDPSLERRLAVKFEVAETLIVRWASGSARPHPRIQAQVLAYLESIKAPS